MRAFFFGSYWLFANGDRVVIPNAGSAKIETAHRLQGISLLNKR